MKYLNKITILSSLFLVLISCETTDLDLLENPNTINVDLADPNFILNDSQLLFRNVYNGYNGSAMAISRMRNQFSTYPENVGVLTLNGAWTNTYRLANNSDLLEAINESDAEGIPYHLGVAKLLEAMAFVYLVDFVGDVPFSEANNPEEFPFPTVDNGETIYDAQFTNIDEAIALLQIETNVLPQDLYYDQDASKWIALANTLKIKMYNQIRLVDPARATSGINSALSSGLGIIDENDKNFQFSYSTSSTPVDSRHPSFTGNYQASGAVGYNSNYLYDIMNLGDDQPPFVENGTADPRGRYYFYRQTNNEPSGSNLPCANTNPESYDYCYVGNLYWGRDHADDEGLPADNLRRTTWGVYPAGGAFDEDQFLAARSADLTTKNGEGILPIFLSSFTHFTLAESALTLGTSGNAATFLELGIRESFEGILDFTGNLDNNSFGASQADIDSYVTRVMTEYNAASSTGKLDIIIREYFIAAYGNGIEPYNNLRRTGFPSSIQAPIQPAGQFPRSYLYPSNEVDVNTNLTQKSLSDQVFWDTNPGGFIN